MIKTLAKHGNSHALIIDKTLMEQLGITPDTPLQVTVTGDGLSVTPANVGIPREELDRALDQIEDQYGDALRRLSQ
ncbi:MAG: AbrB/MazE/SpoVT family DNA-binding domain-containing protein [Phycisphaerales bacterium]